jgi:hypothetical protein
MMKIKISIDSRKEGFVEEIGVKTLSVRHY